MINYKMAKTPMRKRGSRAQVMNGTALRTPGGLRKKDLKYNKNGRIVSKKKSMRAKREKRLEKAGYKTEKGVFGSKYVGDTKSSKRKSKKSKSRSKRSSSWF
tara:strand:- start:647 stop:952 length:306 start_codon:yes stop_codon:yes gene_type:complete